MKIIGHNQNAYICEITREEMYALYPDAYRDGTPPDGTMDILERLKPTLEYERCRLAIPSMVNHLRLMGDDLEKAFANGHNP